MILQSRNGFYRRRKTQKASGSDRVSHKYGLSLTLENHLAGRSYHPSYRDYQRSPAQRAISVAPSCHADRSHQGDANSDPG
jgi:hypothetical protein